MTLTIKGRIGVTTLQTTLERSIKKMDLISFIAGGVTFATPAIAFLSYRHQREMARIDITPALYYKVMRTKQYPEWTRVHITVKNRVDFPILLTKLKSKKEYFIYGGKFTNSIFAKSTGDITTHHDSSSKSVDLNLVVPDSSESSNETTIVLLPAQP